VLFDELAELTGHRNAIDGRIVDIVAEIDGDGLWGSTGCRSISALVAWRTGISPRNAQTVTTVAERLEDFPRCTEALREGRLSLDQVGVVVERRRRGIRRPLRGVGVGGDGDPVADGHQARTPS